MLYRVELIDKDDLLILEQVFPGDAPSHEKKRFENIFNETVESANEDNTITESYYSFELFYLDPERLGGNWRSTRGIERSKSTLASFQLDEKGFISAFPSFYDHYMLRNTIELANSQ